MFPCNSRDVSLLGFLPSTGCVAVTSERKRETGRVRTSLLLFVLGFSPEATHVPACSLSIKMIFSHLPALVVEI